jgi:hypothetical protein
VVAPQAAPRAIVETVRALDGWRIVLRVGKRAFYGGSAYRHRQHADHAGRMTAVDLGIPFRSPEP